MARSAFGKSGQIEQLEPHVAGMTRRRRPEIE
jgi:hypothetical protein